MKYFLLSILIIILLLPSPAIRDYGIPGHCYMQLDSSFIAIGDSIETRYVCYRYPSDKHVCLLPSIDNGYQDSIHCVNLDRRATDQEMADLIFADECVVGRTFVPCLEESINAVR